MEPKAVAAGTGGGGGGGGGGGDGGAGSSSGGGGGSVSATSWNTDIEQALDGCPFEDFASDVKEAFGNGGRVTIERKGLPYRSPSRLANCTSTMSGSWG